MNVPWISKEKIALKALDLIENFQALAEYEVKPPIPVPGVPESCMRWDGNFSTNDEWIMAHILKSKLLRVCKS